MRFGYACGRLLSLLSLVLVPVLASAHPANIAVARAKVAVDGSIELSINFDILAFVLDQTPTLVLDQPMNALLDGTAGDLQGRLNDAKARFLEGLAIGSDDKPGVVDSVQFPTSVEIRKVAAGQQPRIPVMETVVVKCHLAQGEHKVAFRFADVLGTVVVSTEFPYMEPTSDAVEPGAWSNPQQIPTQAEVDAAEASLKLGGARIPATDDPQDEAGSRAAIQAQYNAWSKAYMAHDVDTLLAILSPEYTLKTAQGTLIKYSEYAVMLKLRKQKHSDTTRYSTELLRINLKGTVAAIYSRETTTDTAMNGKTGKVEPVSYQHDYVDVWNYVGGKWRLKSTVTQLEQLLPPAKAK